MYNTRQLRIEDYKYNGAIVTIFAKDDPEHIGDLHVIKHSLEADFEHLYLAVESPPEHIHSTTEMVVKKDSSRDIILTLRDKLLEDIDKVRDDKEYIPQAKQACNLVNTLINLTKLEYQIRRGQ